MKKNIILKGMFLLALCIPRVMEAKTTLGNQGSPQTGQRTGAGQNSGASNTGNRTGATGTSQANVATLSYNAQRLLKYNSSSAAQLRAVFQEEKAAGVGFNKNDIDAIEAEINRLQMGEQQSQATAVLSERDSVILGLQQQLKQSEILINQLLENQKASQEPGFLAKTAMIPVAAAIAGFDKLAYWVAGRESWSARLKATTGYLKMQLDDLGKYPTMRSKLAGITEQDFKNISHIDAELFSEALKQLQSIIRKEESAKSAQEKAQQDKIDNYIAEIRKKYGYSGDENGLKTYLSKLEKHEKTLDKDRAMVSEYLRAQSKLMWLEAEKERKAEEDRKAAEAKRLQQQQASQQQPAAGNPQVAPVAGAPAATQQQPAKSSRWFWQ